MADPSNSVYPGWLFIMRHAQAEWPRVKITDPVLTCQGRAEAREVGAMLASVLDDLCRAGYPVEVTGFLHERTEVALVTALAFQSAYEQTADAIRTEYGHGPPPLAHMAAIGRNLPAYVSDPDPWAKDTITLFTKAGHAPDRGEGAVLIIGHDPGMSCLLATLLACNVPRARRYRDVPGLARAELIGLKRDGRYWKPVWALTSGADSDIAEIKAKIKSKMDTAKVFGGFVTAVLTFVVSQYATTVPRTPFWAAVRGVSLAALAIAILLYLMTLFWYDRLLMPSRFWGILPGGKEDAVSKVLRRPPSSALWVLYQNMQRTWRLLFVPATYATAIGIVGFAAGRIEPSPVTALAIFAASAAVITITAWWGWRSRPILGVRD
jgi:phosphohistidine phosphatase SixA